MGVEGASFHGFVNDESLGNLFLCFLCIFYYRNSSILEILGQFENLGFVIMSSRENIRHIARAPLNQKELSVHMQRMLKMCRCLYIGRTVKQNIWEKTK